MIQWSKLKQSITTWRSAGPQMIHRYKNGHTHTQWLLHHILMADSFFITPNRLYAAQLPPANHTSHKVNSSLQISLRGVDLDQSALLHSDVIHVGARTTAHTLGRLSQRWSRWRHLPQSISWPIGTKRLAFMFHSEIYGRLWQREAACMDACISLV